MAHIPVLLNEVIEIFDPKSGQRFIDATIGEGGHARAILEKTAPDGILLGIDKDYTQIEFVRNELSIFGDRLILRQGSFSNTDAILKEMGKQKMWDGILFDLGWVQSQVKESQRGFSFNKDEILDMRYDTTRGLTAGDILTKESPQYIENILREYAQERFAKSITDEVVKIRRKGPITRTSQLVNIVKSATPFWYHHRRIHPATKTFQALRIAVNNELNELLQGIENAFSFISKNGKIVVITFHSIEDGIVKRLFKEFQGRGSGRIFNKKPITASRLEQMLNPRARSAKLRAFIVGEV